MVIAVRGAIQVGENSRQSIAGASSRLVTEMCERNGLTEEAIVSIVFSVTEDLTAENPAGALRRHGFSKTPLFCVQEAKVEGAMPRVIRVLLTAETAAGGERGGVGSARRTVHVYLDGAGALRPDLET
jgi:chorismate mutase